MIEVPNDLSGRTYGQLLVLGRAEDENVNGYFRAHWRCVCKCGKEVSVWGKKLSGGKKGTCGCGYNVSKGRKVTHGFAKLVDGKQSPLYRAWKGMHARCSSVNGKSAKHYVEKGVKVCDRWAKTPDGMMAFAEDMGPTYQPGLSLDRFPDNNGNYEPGNCRWATMKQQQRNRRDNVLLTGNGKTQCVSAWEEELGLEKRTISRWLGLKFVD